MEYLGASWPGIVIPLIVAIGAVVILWKYGRNNDVRDMKKDIKDIKDMLKTLFKDR